MKLYLLAAIAIGLLGCRFSGSVVSGNGQMTTEIRSVSGFEKLHVGGDFDIILVPGSAFNVQVTADENLHEYIRIDKDGSKLKIAFKDGYFIKTSKTVKVRVAMPKVEALHLAGSGKIKSEGTIAQAEKLNVALAGSGDVDIIMDCPELDADIAGSGNLFVEGKTKKMKLDIAGSGDYRGENLLAEDVEVEVAGSGSARVHASINLDARIAGSGTVYYKGNPAVKKSISGSGEVRPITQ